MPPGDNQLEYNGLLMGPGTDYVVRNIEGLNPPDLRQFESPLTVEHGSYITAHLYEDRLIELQGLIHGDNPHTKLTALKAAMAPRLVVPPFSFKFPGLPVMRSYATATRTYWPYAPGLGAGIAEFVIQLRAGDPRFYSDESDSVSVVSGTTDVADNAGTVDTDPNVSLTGPLTNPIITNQTSGESLKLNAVIAAIDDPVVINFKDKTIKQNNMSKFSWLDPTSVWWKLQPGLNTIALSSDAGAGAAAVSWRSAWV